MNTDAATLVRQAMAYLESARACGKITSWDLHSPEPAEDDADAAWCVTLYGDEERPYEYELLDVAIGRSAAEALQQAVSQLMGRGA